MTYEKAIKALIDAGLIGEDKLEVAVEALEATSVEFTYPDWAEALYTAGVIARLDVEKAIEVMEDTGLKEAQEGGDDFEDALRDAGIY
ncbi:MAG: hypothetical protein ACK2T4_07105 [Candidatus Promineifilaceae bacterium]|jgi:hypothetical protein